MAQIMTTRQLITAWWVSLIVSSYVGLQFVMQSSIGTIMAQLQRDFDVDILAVSVLSSVYYLTYLLMQIPAGLITDRFGARRTVLISLVCFIISVVSFALAPYFIFAELARLLMGLCVAPALTCSMWIASRWFTPHYFPLAAGVIETMGMLGGALGYAILDPLSHSALGWRGAMLMVAMVACVLLGLVFATVRDNASASMSTASAPPTSDYWTGCRQLFASPRVWWCGVYSGMMFTVVTGFASLWSVPFLSTAYPGFAAHAAHMTALLFIGAALGTPSCGWLSEIVGRERLMLSCALVSLILMSTLIYWPGLRLWQLNGLMFLLGVSCSVYVLPFVIMRDIVPAHQHGLAMGYTNMMCILFGAPLLQPLIGFGLQVLSHSSLQEGVRVASLADYQHVMWLFPLCLVIAFGCVFGLRGTSHAAV